MLIFFSLLLWFVGLVGFAFLSRKITDSWIISIGGGFLFGIALLMTFIFAISDKEQKEEIKQEPVSTSSKYKACNDSSVAECALDKNYLTITSACKRSIESRALYEFEWTDGFLDTKFSRVYWVMPHEIISLDGDKIKMQNGFGAMQNHIYQCWYNIEDKTVEKIIINPGKYPK